MQKLIEPPSLVEEIGPVTAWVAGTGHELWDNVIEPVFTDAPVSPMDEVLMDLHNNSVGRSAGSSGTAINNSDLRVLETNPGQYEYMRNRVSPGATNTGSNGIYDPSTYFSSGQQSNVSQASIFPATGYSSGGSVK